MDADPIQHEDESVRHLVELGYVDSIETAAQQAELQRRREDEIRRAVDLMGQDRAPEARELLDKLAAEHPGWIAPRQLLAQIHFHTGNWNAASLLLKWLAEHNVITPRLAMMNAAIALKRHDSRGLAESAMHKLEYACHVDPTLVGARSLMGSAQMRLSRWDDAEDSFQQAVRLNPSDARALDGLAAIAILRRDFERAAHYALESLGLDMQLFHAHYHLGIALTRLGRTEAAEQALMTAARLDPHRAAPFYWLARIALGQRGDSAGADALRARGREIIRQRRSSPIVGTSTSTCSV